MFTEDATKKNKAFVTMTHSEVSKNHPDGIRDNESFENLGRMYSYENRPLGLNKLGNMMKTTSSAADLSKVYINHSVGAMSITLWSNAGLTNRHIMAISGHRSEQSLVHYNQRPSTSQLKRSSEVISEVLGDHM